MKNRSQSCFLWNLNEESQAEERNPHSSFFILHLINFSLKKCNSHSSFFTLHSSFNKLFILHFEHSSFNNKTTSFIWYCLIDSRPAMLLNPETSSWVTLASLGIGKGQIYTQVPDDVPALFKFWHPLQNAIMPTYICLFLFIDILLLISRLLATCESSINY